MKKLLVAVAVVGSLLGASTVQALSITPGMAIASGNQTGQGDIDTAIAGILGTATELYKADVGAANDVGTLAASYETTYSNTPANPSDALIEYVAGDIVGAPAFLLVKDGNQVPAWYLFNLTASPLSWNGMADLELSGFWPQQGAISHVTLYGTRVTPDPDPMPEPTTMVLFGLGLLGAGVARRRVRS